MFFLYKQSQNEDEMEFGLCLNVDSKISPRQCGKERTAGSADIGMAGRMKKSIVETVARTTNCNASLNLQQFQVRHDEQLLTYGI